LRAHLAELGIAAAKGRDGLKQLLKVIADEKSAVTIEITMLFLTSSSYPCSYRPEKASGAPAAHLPRCRARQPDAHRPAGVKGADLSGGSAFK
jgi:hypothetical protein